MGFRKTTWFAFEISFELINQNFQDFLSSNSLFTGMGVMTFADGSTYSGRWMKNKYHAWGTYVNKSDGTTYVGEWEFGVREGEGTLKMANGDVYSGSFQGDRRNGKGYCCFANQVFFSPFQSKFWFLFFSLTLFSLTLFHLGCLSWILEE